MGFSGQFEADEPLWAIVLIIVFLFGSAASGGFAGGAVAWAALRNNELTRVARRASWAFTGITVMMWVFVMVFEAAGLVIPLFVYTVAAMALILVVARRDYR